MSLLELSAIGARIGGEEGQAALHAVDALLDQAGRLRDAVGLAIDQGDDVGDVTDSFIDLREARLGDPAAIDADLDFRRDGLGLAGERSDGTGDLARRGARVVGQLLHFGRDDGEGSACLARACRLDRGIECEHVRLVGDRLDARGDFLHPGHRFGEARHPIAELDDQVSQAGEDPDRVLYRAASLIELAPRLLGKHTRLVGGIGHSRLVGKQAGRHFLE